MSKEQDKERLSILKEKIVLASAKVSQGENRETKAWEKNIRLQEGKLKAIEKYDKEVKKQKEKSFGGKVVNKLKKWNKALDKPLKNRQVLKKANRVSINVGQPVYSRDKSRFFKEQWEADEKQQLFFS